MIKNYFLVAFRNLKRYKVYSLVNILGLAVGMSAFILIALLLQNENIWDLFHKDNERIYRIQSLVELNNSTEEWTQSVHPLSNELRNNYAEFEEVVVIREVWGELLASDDDKKFQEKDGFYVEPEFFDLFTVKFLQGNPKTALNNEGSIVLTDELAKKYFPDTNPMGKSINSGVNGHLIVSAVIERWPEQAHIRPSYLVGFSELRKRYNWEFQEDWGSYSFRTYVKLSKNTAATTVNGKIRDILDDKVEDNNKRLYLRPLANLHLAPRTEDEYNSPLPYYAAVAWFVLLLACINYINLTTAKSAQREKEIGVRKVVGGNRWLLFKQFIGESLLITSVALVASFFIAELLLPVFNSFMMRNLSIGYLDNLEFMFNIIGMMTIVGIVSGIYPAIYLSSFNPISVIKGQTSLSKLSGSKGVLRRLLVGFQFVVSISLIVLTYYIYNQVSFMKNKDLGLNVDNMIMISMPNNESEKSFEELRTRLLENKNILNASICSSAPFFSSDGWEVNWEGGEPDEKINARTNRVGYHFIDNYDIEIMKGRGFSKEFSTDDKNCVVNETFIKKVGWAESPIGKTIADGKYTIIGVVKDFHPYSVHSEIPPYFFRLHSGEAKFASQISIKLNANKQGQTVAEINDIFKEFFPNSLYQIVFYENHLEYNVYDVWNGVQSTFGYFSFITILIALIGVISLVAFSVEKKSKEIGIRKVLGASAKSIYLIVNKDFFIIIILSALIGIPIAKSVIGITPGYYKFEMEVIDFAIPIIVTGIIALIATAFLAVKAAFTNPIESLKDE